MANCPKCDASVVQPTKTWKIKQTPIALYECPSCKLRWRNKLTIEAAVITPQNPPETQEKESMIEAETLVKPVTVSTLAAAPVITASLFSGLRRFFSSILNI
ncbi:hypothetical protein MUP00_12330 [Candidatus Bathyarchaeota archaeon]|jgi:uncharacterized protein YlaI|nr:hypothetical protein [Candidatus Bathyarchaeota archaeon]